MKKSFLLLTLTLQFFTFNSYSNEYVEFEEIESNLASNTHFQVTCDNYYANVEVNFENSITYKLNDKLTNKMYSGTAFKYNRFPRIPTIIMFTTEGENKLINELFFHLHRKNLGEFKVFFAGYVDRHKGIGLTIENCKRKLL